MKQREANRQKATDQSANVRDKGQKSRNGTSDEAELQTNDHETHRIENAKDEADGALPTDERGKRFVDLGRDAADLAQMIARQEAVDLSDHIVPIIEQVDRHNGHDDQ